MIFRLTKSSGHLDRVWILSCAVLLMILAENAAAQGRKGKKPMAVCNENCQRSKCDVGQTCNKISNLNRSYDCFECQNCVNMRKHEEKIEPNEVLKLDEECLHIRVQCGVCPACPKAVPLVLPSNFEITEESTERTGRMPDHEFFKYWCALVVSVAFNLLLLCIMISCRSKSSKKTKKAEDDRYENVSWVEMDQK